MTNRSINLLRKLSDLLKDFVHADSEDLSNIMNEYSELSEREKVVFIDLIYDSLKDSKQQLLQLLTLFTCSDNNSYALKLIGRIALEADLSPEELLEFFIQYRYVTFVANSCSRGELITIYKRLIKELKSLLSHSYNYVDYSKRNSNRVLLVTDQILSELHAPTLILVNQYYYLKKAGYKVDVLVVSEKKIPVPDVWIGHAVYFDNITNQQGPFTLNYQGQTIEGTTLFLETSDLKSSVTSALDAIRDYNPAFVISIGEMNLIPDIASMFTTVVTKTTTKNIPFTLSRYVMYRDVFEYDGYENYMDDDIVVLQNYFMNVLVPPEEGSEDIIDNLHQENRFKIVIVGNRLDNEISTDFVIALNNLAERFPDLVFVVVGSCKGLETFVQKSGYIDHYYFTGCVRNLSGVTKECDVFLNPPRDGGGFSAELALKHGLPVITLGNCDAAEWAGPEYICASVASMIEDLKKCYSDLTYLNMRSEKAIERWKSKTLSENDGIDNTKSFCAEVIEYIKKEKHL